MFGWRVPLGRCFVTLLDKLNVGADAAITLSRLAEMTGQSRRAIEAAIHDARLQGVPICTDHRGAWLATAPQEAREQASRLRTRAIHQFETAQALERAADKMAHQPTLWEAA